jgi:hypothetical protein
MPNPMATSTCADAASTARPRAAPRIFLFIFATPSVERNVPSGALPGELVAEPFHPVPFTHSCVPLRPRLSARRPALPSPDGRSPGTDPPRTGLTAGRALLAKETLFQGF